MPRRSILSTVERDNLLALPSTEDELIRHCTFSETDISLIRQRRGNANRLGFFPGHSFPPDVTVPLPLLQWVGQQINCDPACWSQYSGREETRREHLLELRAYLGLVPFGLGHYRQAIHTTTELALHGRKTRVKPASVKQEVSFVPV